MKIDNLVVKGSWQEVLNDARFTVGKPALNKEPSEKFKRDILKAEHSPIRDISIKFDFIDLGTCYITHFTRSKWEKYVQTQRTDITNVDRHNLPQDSPNSMRGEANVQHLIDTSRKRLCFKSSKETRQAWELLKYELHKIEPHIADVMVPNCVYRCGCPESTQCSSKMCEKWLPFAPCDLTNIETRYKLYNDWLYDLYKKKEDMNHE